MKLENGTPVLIRNCNGLLVQPLGRSVMMYSDKFPTCLVEHDAKGRDRALLPVEERKHL